MNIKPDQKTIKTIKISLLTRAIGKVTDRTLKHLKKHPKLIRKINTTCSKYEVVNAISRVDKLLKKLDELLE